MEIAGAVPIGCSLTLCFTGRAAALRRPRPRPAGGTEWRVICPRLAPLNAARTAQRAIPTQDNSEMHPFRFAVMPVGWWWAGQQAGLASGKGIR